MITFNDEPVTESRNITCDVSEPSEESDDSYYESQEENGPDEADHDAEIIEYVYLGYDQMFYYDLSELQEDSYYDDFYISYDF